MASSSICPAGKLRRPLIALRSLQVACSALSCVNNAYLLFIFVPLHRVISASSQYSSAAPFVAAMIGIFVLSLALGVASLVCSILFLTYTLSPKGRYSSCGGGCTPCVRYSCDFGWDCCWAALWGITLILGVLGASRNSVGAAVVSVAFCAALFLLYVATAVMSSKVRRAVIAGPALPLAFAGGRDVEAAAVVVSLPVVGVVATDMYASQHCAARHPALQQMNSGDGAPYHQLGPEDTAQLPDLSDGVTCRPAIGVPVHKV